VCYDLHYENNTKNKGTIMGFVKGTDGIARTVLNPLEGSIGDIDLNNVSVNTFTATGNITGGNLSVTNIAGTLTTAAQPNITSVGMLSDLDVSGNVVSFGGASFSTTITGGDLQTFGNITCIASPSAGNVIAGNLIASGNVIGNVSGFSLGYRDIPQVSFAGNATIATTDAGKHYYSTQSTSYTLTIANNASQAFQTGSAVTIINQGTGNINVAQGSGVTLYLAGNATSGNRTISTFGMATMIKVATNTWFINGTGVA
jgi:hypothetical protein